LRVDLRVAVFVQNRVAVRVEAGRRARGGDRGGELAVERDLFVRVDLAVVEREQDVGAVDEAAVGQRAEQLAQAGVVVRDDRGDLSAVRPGRRRVRSVE